MDCLKSPALVARGCCNGCDWVMGRPKLSRAGSLAACDQRCYACQVLAMVDSLTVSQETEALEALVNAFGIGYEGSNS